MHEHPLKATENQRKTTNPRPSLVLLFRRNRRPEEARGGCPHTDGRPYHSKGPPQLRLNALNKTEILHTEAPLFLAPAAFYTGTTAYRILLLPLMLFHHSANELEQFRWDAAWTRKGRIFGTDVLR